MAEQTGHGRLNGCGENACTGWGDICGDDLLCLKCATKRTEERDQARDDCAKEYACTMFFMEQMEDIDDVLDVDLDETADRDMGMGAQRVRALKSKCAAVGARWKCAAGWYDSIRDYAPMLNRSKPAKAIEKMYPLPGEGADDEKEKDNGSRTEQS